MIPNNINKNALKIFLKEISLIYYVLPKKMNNAIVEFTVGIG